MAVPIAWERFDPDLSLTDENTGAALTGLLAGLVERVTFHNADTGFCVLRVKARGQRDLITVIGHAAAIMMTVNSSSTGASGSSVRTPHTVPRGQLSASDPPPGVRHVGKHERERQAVGLREIRGDDAYAAARRVDAVDVVGADLAGRRVAFVLRVDAVALVLAEVEADGPAPAAEEQRERVERAAQRERRRRHPRRQLQDPSRGHQ